MFVRHFVQNCLSVLRTKLYTIAQHYLQNCTLQGPAGRAPLARSPPAAPAPGQADCFACVLLPTPSAAPRLFSCNALPLQITGARFTFQNRASCAEQVRPTQVRRRRQRLVAARR